MANSYIKFSTSITVADIDKTLNTISRWRDLGKTKLGEELDISPDERPYLHGYLNVLGTYEDSNGARHLTVSSDEGCNIDILTTILHKLIQVEPDEQVRWTIPYAYTCDRLLFGEFGGGAMIITKKWGVIWDTVSVMDAIETALGETGLYDLIGKPDKTTEE